MDTETGEAMRKLPEDAFITAEGESTQDEEEDSAARLDLGLAPEAPALPSLAIGMGSPSLLSEIQCQLAQTSETMKAGVARALLDPVVASRAAALMEEIGTILLEGTQSTFQGGDAGQEEGIENEKDRQQPRRQHQNED
jgi:hypothetical protein